VTYSAVERARSDSAAEMMTSFSMDVDGRGNVYVADAWAIRVFGPDGHLSRTIGRQGQGPGEFSRLLSVELMPGDSLFAFDADLKRVSVFAPGASRVAYTVQVGRDETFPAWQVWRVRKNHSVAALFQAAYVIGQEQGFAQRKGVVRLFNADGSLRKDSVLAVRQPEYLIVAQPHSVMLTGHPFGRKTLLALSRHDRIVSAWSDSLNFEIYTPEGRRVKTVRGNYPAVNRPVSARERDSVIADLGRGAGEPVIRRAMDEHDRKTWPLLQDIIVDDQDRIWAGIIGARGEPTHWVAFDMSGDPVARVDLPGTVWLRLVRGNTAYAASIDENDVPRVVVYDLKPSGTLALNGR
jgi:hypothetical protein